MPDRCSPARVRFAAPKTGAPLPAPRRSGPMGTATGGSGGNTIEGEIRFSTRGAASSAAPKNKTDLRCSPNIPKRPLVPDRLYVVKCHPCARIKLSPICQVEHYRQEFHPGGLNCHSSGKLPV